VTITPSALDSIAGLAEPNRRRLYDYIADQRGWVSREQAADAVGIGRGVAAHHLDRLADDGLLETDYQQLSERRGPGSGRPSKVYRRSPAEVDLSLPPRRYELAGRLLARAADRIGRDDVGIGEAVADAARTEGRQLGDAAGRAVGPRGSRRARRTRLLEELVRLGYEPEARDDGGTTLRNCPFHSLAQEHTDLVCGMNLELVAGLIEGVGACGLRGTLAPDERACCVRLDPV
jgi:predicted ArsR family transcriptional regulator